MAISGHRAMSERSQGLQSWEHSLKMNTKQLVQRAMLLAGLDKLNSLSRTASSMESLNLL